jgi:hypothetical protein
MQLAPRLAAPRSGCTFPRRRLGWTRSKRSRLVNPRHARRTVALRASASPNVRQDRCRVRASPRACAKALSSCGPPCPTAPSLTAWRTRTFAPSLHQAPSFKTTASVSHAPWRTANRPSKRPRFLDRKEVCFSISGWAEDGILGWQNPASIALCRGQRARLKVGWHTLRVQELPLMKDFVWRRIPHRRVRPGLVVPAVEPCEGSAETAVLERHHFVCKTLFFEGADEALLHGDAAMPANSKDNGARAWTPATRSAMAVIGSHGAGKQSYNAAIFAAGSSFHAGGESREAHGEIRRTGLPERCPPTRGATPGASYSA